MLWKNALPCSTFHLVFFIWPLLSFIFIKHWINGTPSPLSVFPLNISHETDVVWVQKTCRFTAASSHSVILWTCARETCESLMTLFLHPRLKVRRSCVNRSVWLVQIHRIWGKECCDAKCATVTNSSTMCLTHISLFMGTLYLTNLYAFPWNFLTPAVGWKALIQKVSCSISSCLMLLFAQYIGSHQKMLSWENSTFLHRELMSQKSINKHDSWMYSVSKLASKNN